MTYAEALNWLFSQNRAGGARGLGRIQELLHRLGNPERSFKAIHILGTNGKGSTAAYLEAALGQDSYGITTSPHLLDFKERIRTHQGPITETAVIRFVQWAQSQAFLEAPAFFDLTCALAFWHFAQNRIPLAAVEAGVGGLHDATQVLPNVILSIITNVGEDHLNALGGSLLAIARDKAAAIRPGIPVVTAASGEPLAMIKDVCIQQKSAIYVLDSSPLFTLPKTPSLPGGFQENNARLAAAALRLLGYPESAVVLGITTAVHPGRMQRIWVEGVEVILDGAHNPPAAQAIATELESFHLVYGALAKKDHASMLKHLLPKALSTRYAQFGHPASIAIRPCFNTLGALEDALAAAKEDPNKKEPVPVLVTGSLYLVAEALAILQLPARG
jgi:dihydrofolate synthase / folylpolyglutamate synthase